MKLASVIIPTWNRKKLLAEAVESALAQTYRPLEVVVVDDGSTDGTREMMEELSRKSAEDVSIRFFLRPHLGVSAARQHGLEMARGEYVQFLDSDDLLLPEKLEKQIAEMERTQSACCLCHVRRGWFDAASPCGKDSSIWPSLPLIGREIHSARDALAALASGEPYAISTPALLFRKGSLSQIPPWPEEFCNGEDLVYFVRFFLSRNPSPIAFVDEPLALIRDHGGNRATVVPRLRDWAGVGGDEFAVRRSSLLARAEMVRELVTSEEWCRGWKGGCAAQLRTGYWDALHVLEEDELREFEKLLLSLSSHFSVAALLVSLRRAFGRRIPVSLLQKYLSRRLRGGVSDSGVRS